MNNTKENKPLRQTDIYNPASGEIIKTISFHTEQEIKDTIQKAKNAFKTWSAVSPLRRARVMFRFLELLHKNIDTLTAIVTEEHGKVLTDARGEVQRGIENVEFATGTPSFLKGDYTDSIGTGIDSYAMRQPLGVVAGITPFNFPAMVPLWMFPLAIACGNTFVLKPSERNPSVSIFMAELLKEAGLPEGVFNVILGDKESVDLLLTHPDIDAISFVGSTPVAEHVYQTGINHGKRVQALAGAKNHMIVMPDAITEQAADALMGAAYGSAGERCMAISVAVTVGDDTADSLIKDLSTKIKNLKIAPGTDVTADMGPLITKQHHEKVCSYIQKGIDEGAALVIDGRDVIIKGHEKGYFLGGCLFDHVKPEMTIYKEEIFGPVLSVVRVNTYDEALKLVNNHAYGNGAAIFTNDGGTARNFARDVKAGMVGINFPIPVPAAFHSFGGWKRSLFGDMSIYGQEGIRFYTKLKTVTTRWPLQTTEGANFDF